MPKLGTEKLQNTFCSLAGWLIVKFVFVSEMVTAELLSTAHGQVALKAVQRFLSHNPEWVGQTIGRVEHSLQNLLLVGGEAALMP